LGIYSVNIIGLSNKLHQFEYEIGDAFFEQYGTDLISKGNFHAEVTLDKQETMISAVFTLKGTATLVCDRSLETFGFPMERRHPIVFKLGDKDEELSDEIVMIHRDTATLELGQYLFEFIVLAIPLKKLHPKFRDEVSEEDDEAANGKIVYTSESKKDNPDDDDEIDPRWNILKNLK
jgi:uncharacterized metal-binding protein YceD (DUF177 family)